MRASFIALGAALSMAGTAGVVEIAEAREVWVAIDQARPLKLKRPIASMVIGNPSIADVTVQDEQTIFVFGKSQGVTNIYILDSEGETLENMTINVTTSRKHILTLNRGMNQRSYTCAHRCEPVAVVGDENDAFARISNQASSKISQALKAAEAAGDGGGS